MKSKLTYFILAVVAIATGRWIGAVAGQTQAQKEVPRAEAKQATQAILPPVVAQPFVWRPSGSEYSIAFSSEPKVSETKSGTPGGEIIVEEAVLMPKVGFQKADFIPILRTETITKEYAYESMSNFARDYALEHIDIRFNDKNPDDIIATLRGTKIIDTKQGAVVMAFLAEGHWGRKCVFTAVLGEPAKLHPTPEGLAFIESIHRVK